MVNRKSGTVVSNFIYNSSFQILQVILPLITIPYISRVLRAENVGIYNYTYSIVIYFAMLAHLGFDNYGNRLIAKQRDDSDLLNESFSGVFLFQLISSITAILAYGFYILFFCTKNKDIAIVQSLYIIAELFNVTWLYFGLEEFRLTTIRNLVVRVISLTLIFLLVKKTDDLLIYTLICAGSSLLGSLILWIGLFKRVHIVKVSLQEILSHAKKCLILFFPVIVIKIYRTMAKIMLGNLSTMTEVAIYSYSDRIVEIPYGIIAALGVVMLPRMSYYVSSGEKDLSLKYIELSMKFMIFMSCGMAFGLMGIGKIFAPIFFGQDFIKCGTLIMIIAPEIIILSMANVVRSQYLLPHERDKDYIISILIGLLINLLINFIFIPRWASLGAAVATLFTESFVAMYQIFSCRNDLPIKKYIFENSFFLFDGIIMFLFIYIIGEKMGVSIKTLIFQIVIGGIIYLLLAIGYLYKTDRNLLEKIITFWRKKTK